MATEVGDFDRVSNELPGQPWAAPTATQPLPTAAQQTAAQQTATQQTATQALPVADTTQVLPPVPPLPPAPVAIPPKRRRRRWVRLAALLVVLGLVGGGGWVVLRDQWRDATPPAAQPGSPPAPPLHPNQIATDREAVDDLFEGRADAVDAEDLEAFLADLDPANKKLVRGQRTLFKNLDKLPVKSYQQIVSRYSPPTPMQPGNFDGNWGPGRATIDVQLQLDEADRRPTVASYEVRLQLRDGKLVITQLTSEALSHPYAPTPWEALDLTVVRTKHMLIAVTPDAKGRARELADAAERAYKTSLGLWPKNAASEFVIFGTTKRSTYENWYGLGDDETQSSVGKAIPVPTCCGTKSTLLGDTSSTHIILDLSKMDTRVDLEWVVAHELTHAVAQPRSSDDFDVPAWADEGYAEYVGVNLLEARGYFAYWARDVREYVRDGKFKGKLPADSTFYGKNSHINYALSVRFFEYLVGEYGESKAKNFYFHLNGMKIPDVDAAMRKYFKASEKEIVKGWAAWIRSS